MREQQRKFFMEVVEGEEPGSNILHFCALFLPASLQFDGAPSWEAVPLSPVRTR